MSRNKTISEATSATTFQIRDEDVTRYNQARARFGKERALSTIKEIRDFNNWAKSFFITTVVDMLKNDNHTNNSSGDDRNQRNNFVIMDLCCGKGGDMSKWKNKTNDIYYMTFADQAHTSLAECIQRYNEAVSAQRGITFAADFLLGDLFHPQLKLEQHFLPYNNGARFDLISCMLALHYAFKTEANAIAAFTNISKLLRVGGYFMCVYTNKNSLLKLLENKGYTQEKFLENPTEPPPLVEESVYNFRFCDPFPLNPWTNQEVAGLEPLRPHKYGKFPFGFSYKFKLVEAVNDIIEYVVDDEVIKNIAKEVGLEVVKYCPNFGFAEQEFLRSNPNPHEMTYHNRAFESTSGELQQRSGRRGEFTINDLKNKSSIDVCSLYQTYIFKKMKPLPSDNKYVPITSVLRKETRPRKLLDVVTLNGEDSIAMRAESIRKDMKEKLWKPVISEEF